ncbi:MAG: 4-hydroxythreonine-4-phosphate dehydrogenase PdxA [Ignavibacteriaceae bacterium]
MNRFIFTCGDINGIGPEIVLKALNKLTAKKKADRFLFICPKNIFESTSKIITPKFNFAFAENVNEDFKNQVIILSLKNTKQNLGKPTKSSGKSSYDSIRLSFELLKNDKADSVITAPISKTAINLAGINFPGHTEMYAQWCGVKNFVMMFLSNKMNASLLTIHIPIKKVPGLINQKLFFKTLGIISNTLKIDLNINSPSIAVLGLNPHAGENGLIGDEEKNIIFPLIKKYAKKFNVSGPFVADAFFANHLYIKYNIVLGMYHDQVLIPFKMLNFSHGVNYTAGLPIVRTSPDHGTAFDIAGENLADETSMLEAFYYAEKIVKNRKRNIKNKKE